MEKIFGTNWRTTVTGLIGGIAQILVPTLGTGQPIGTIHSEQWISAGLFALLGILAGDSKK